MSEKVNKENIELDMAVRQCKIERDEAIVKIKDLEVRNLDLLQQLQNKGNECQVSSRDI